MVSSYAKFYANIIAPMFTWGIKCFPTKAYFANHQVTRIETYFTILLSAMLVDIGVAFGL